MSKKSFILSAAAGILAISTTSSCITVPEKVEKCYGIAKTGKNDCGDLKAKHYCSGGAKKDGDKNEWMYVLDGTCNRIVGGILIKDE